MALRLYKCCFCFFFVCVCVFSLRRCCCCLRVYSVCVCMCVLLQKQVVRLFSSVFVRCLLNELEYSVALSLSSSCFSLFLPLFFCFCFLLILSLPLHLHHHMLELLQRHETIAVLVGLHDHLAKDVVPRILAQKLRHFTKIFKRNLSLLI